MSSKPIKPEAPVHVPRKLYKPMPVQNRVVAGHMAGESNRQIATRLGIDRATVSRILSQEELVATIADQQSLLLSLGYKAIATFAQTLDCHDARTAVKTAEMILVGTGVMNKQGLQGTIDTARKRAASQSQDFVWPPVEEDPPSLAIQLVPAKLSRRRASAKRRRLERLVADDGTDDGGTEPR